jgi:hypothetical protein
MRIKSGEKLTLQTTGLLFSIGDRSEGRKANEAIRLGLQRHGVPHFA